jgi:hypothetical protein
MKDMAVKQFTPRNLTDVITEEFVELSPSSILESRLIEGERRIAIAEARGEDTTHLIDFWIELLHQYEDVFDESYPKAA